MLSLEVGTNPRQARGVYIAELAGSRNRAGGWKSRTAPFTNHPNGIAITTQGRALIDKLNQQRAMKGAGGRYIYDKFRLLRPDVMSRAERALEPLLKQINRKLS